MSVSSFSRYRCRAVAAAFALAAWFAVTMHISIQSSLLLLSSSSSSSSSGPSATRTSENNSNSNNDYYYLRNSTTSIGMATEKDPLSSFCHGKEPLVQILHDAGIANATDHCPNLPTWSQVVDLYGPEPVIDGLEQESCATYHRNIMMMMTMMMHNANTNSSSNNNNKTNLTVYPRIAGLFNTGTNALAKLLQRNLLKVEQTHYFYYDVPWGKHVPYRYRWNVTLPKHNPTPKTLVLPIVLIRDPYWWMQSMCKTAYGVKWKHTTEHCPNLTPDEQDNTNDVDKKNSSGGKNNNNNNSSSSVPVVTKYSFGRKDPVRFQLHHDSLVHLWNDYYEEYLSVREPRLLVRFEDMLFHGPLLLQKLATCLQLPVVPTAKHFEYIVETSKQHHGSGTTLVAAMARYGSTKGRTNGMTAADLEYARQHLNGELLRRFHYTNN